MSVLYVLVPAALLLVLAAVVAFVWAARQGQFDDTTTPAWRAMLDDDPARPPPGHEAVARDPTAAARSAQDTDVFGRGAAPIPPHPVPGEVITNR